MQISSTTRETLVSHGTEDEDVGNVNISVEFVDGCPSEVSIGIYQSEWKQIALRCRLSGTPMTTTLKRLHVAIGEILEELEHRGS